MIINSNFRQFLPGSCKPIYRAHTVIGAHAITVKVAKTNEGKHWTWGGTYPHNTRMHQYGLLPSGTKADWRTLAATMHNGHSSEGVTTYNGPIAYMQFNFWQGILGIPWSFTPPLTPAPSAGVLTTFSAPPPPNSTVLLTTH